MVKRLVAFRASESLIAWVKAESSREGVTISHYINRILEERRRIENEISPSVRGLISA